LSFKPQDYSTYTDRQLYTQMRRDLRSLQRDAPYRLPYVEAVRREQRLRACLREAESRGVQGKMFGA
jgi:hypothetical protein